MLDKIAPLRILADDIDQYFLLVDIDEVRKRFERYLCYPINGVLSTGDKVDEAMTDVVELIDLMPANRRRATKALTQYWA
tara:strand:- start:989 stop:1228 length:240 start_codon:yes stop_codon:yes gene_type:complete